MFGQVCEPDETYADTTGVFPPPFDIDSCPDCGITDTACIGNDYVFIFTIAVGETIEIVPGFPQALDSVVVLDITGLPVGINYACNPSSCVFPQQFLGCAVLSGIPTAANAPGDYSLEISTEVYTGGSPLPIPITFPNALIAPGEYILRLEADGHPNCLVGTNDILESQVELKNVPNPTNGWTQIQISSQISDDFELNVVDLMGKSIYTEKIKVNEGNNYFDFDGTDLPDGIYIYSIGNNLGVVSKKMIINKR